MFKPCIIIPVYNHDQALKPLIKNLNETGLAIILVNDGSAPHCAEALRDIASKNSYVTLIEHEENGGKGKAIKTALKTAYQLNFTHALQIDADGQHDIKDIPTFLEKAQATPNAIISGTPIYDDSIPKHRHYGRYATHVWVWINTLSFQISDSMCGFRCYPVKIMKDIIGKYYIGDRMDFDIEILVKSYWEGTQIIELPTRVIYPEEGTSNFRIFRDNVSITWMHTRLFFGMLTRLPKLLIRLGKQG